MRLCIKQRVFSWGDTYDIYDEQGNEKYLVKEETFTFGHPLHVFDKQGREIGCVNEVPFSFSHEYEITIGGVRRGSIHKRFTLFFQKYDVDLNGWYVEGDFLDWDYDVYSNGRVVAHINKEWLAWGDTYTIDIENPEDELMAVMLVVAIDATNRDKN
ncbi:MAG: LURP-one-related family protein [Agathobacter sp.]|nr:LURP-one-related family protein [Agathobacter sp.]